MLRSRERSKSGAQAAAAARMCQFCCTVLLAAFASVNVGYTADDTDVIAYRQHVMKSLNEQTATLGQILATVIPDDNFVSHLEAIAATASTALKAFEPKVPGGETKPEVWTNWADFSKRMTELAEKTALAAKAVKENRKEEVMSGIADTLSCKGCHDRYRDEKKK